MTQPTHTTPSHTHTHSLTPHTLATLTYCLKDLSAPITSSWLCCGVASLLWEIVYLFRSHSVLVCFLMKVERRHCKCRQNKFLILYIMAVKQSWIWQFTLIEATYSVFPVEQCLYSYQHLYYYQLQNIILFHFS